MTHSWNDVRLGDKIKVQHTKGGVIEGEYQKGLLDSSEWVTISGLNYLKSELTILEHKTSYQDGDIGLYADPLTKATYVGVYSDSKKAFMDSTHRTAGMMFYPYCKGIKIVGNIHKEDDTWT